MAGHVVVGGGPAAAAAAAAIARAGQDVVVLTAEDRAPYDRTVLSKSVLTAPDGEADVPPLWPDGQEWLARLDLRTGTVVERLDTSARTVTTAAGEAVHYERLLLATGATPRHLGGDFDGDGVHHLREATDAERLREALGGASRLVVVGGGVIGLEVAAAARDRGVEVHVVEAGPRLLTRGVPEPVATWLADLHTGRGVQLHLGVRPEGPQRRDGRLHAVRLADGTVLEADHVVVGIGITPRDGLARDAGLTVDDGIVVDASGRTSDADVYAAGDVVRMDGVRLESYQAAGQQGEVAARAMLGEDAVFTEVPWTWSDQYDAVLQTSGLVPAPGGGVEHVVLDGDDAVVVVCLDGGRLVAVSGVGRGPAVARPVRAAQGAIASGVFVDVGVLREAGGDLRALAAVLRSAAGDR